MIWDLPVLANVRRLHVRGILAPRSKGFVDIANVHVRLIGSLGSLEELTLSHCDMRLSLIPFPFLGDPEIHELEKPIVCPPIRVLTIFNPATWFTEDVATGLVRLAKAQYELGTPFERVMVQMYHEFPTNIEDLRQWVGAVDFRRPDDTCYIMTHTMCGGCPDTVFIHKNLFYPAVSTVRTSV